MHICWESLLFDVFPAFDTTLAQGLPIDRIPRALEALSYLSPDPKRVEEIVIKLAFRKWEKILRFQISWLFQILLRVIYMRGLFRPRSLREDALHTLLYRSSADQPLALDEFAVVRQGMLVVSQLYMQNLDTYCFWVCQMPDINIKYLNSIYCMYYVWSEYLSSLYKLTIAGGTDERVKLGSRVWSMCCPHESSGYRYLYAVLYCARCILHTGADKYVISVSKSLGTKMGDYEIAVRLLGRWFATSRCTERSKSKPSSISWTKMAQAGRRTVSTGRFCDWPVLSNCTGPCAAWNVLRSRMVSYPHLLPCHQNPSLIRIHQ